MIIKRIIAASTLALLSACAGPQVREEAETSAVVPPSVYENNPYALTEADITDEQLAIAAEQADIADEQAAIAANRIIDATPRSAFKHVPTPSAGFPPAQTYPPISAQSLRTSMLRLLDSIHRPEDTNREHVEAIMGVKMGKPLQSDRYFTYDGSVDEGWKYYVDVTPTADLPTSRIQFDLQTDNPADFSGSLVTQCTFGLQPFLDELRERGWEIEDKAVYPGGGRWAHYFQHRIPEHGVEVYGSVILSSLTHGNPNQLDPDDLCVTGLIIYADAWSPES